MALLNRAKRRSQRVREPGEYLREAMLIVLAIIIFYPLVLMVFLSFKDINQFYHATWTPTWPLHWENYSSAWTMIGRYIWNTIVVAVATAAGVVIVSSLSAYVFARFDFPGRQALFYAIISLMMVPGVLSLVSSFVLVRNMGILNTRTVLIVPAISGGQVFGIFLLRSFFAGLPEDLFEAARLDGANNLVLFKDIALPLSRPILTTLAIMQLLGAWNDIIWPLVTIRDERLYTISIGLSFFEGTHQSIGLYGPMFAGYVIAAMPLVLLFTFASKQFVSGLTSGAIKL